MSDIYVPGINSRFNSEKIIEDLMRLERVPRDRAQNNIEKLETEKSYWQDISRRTNSLRESARMLYSFQNPFSERLVRSGDEMVITGTANRDTAVQERTFTVKQVAQADRFLSSPLEENFRVESGTYSFTVGEEEISFDFRGGTLKEFTESLNRRGRNLIQSSLVTVKPGTRSLLIESKVTGAENRLSFGGASQALGEITGMTGRVNDSRVDFTGEVLDINAGNSLQVPINFEVPSSGNWVLKYDLSTAIKTGDIIQQQKPPPGPSIPSSGSISYGGIVIENDESSVTLPVWTPPPPPRRIDNMQIASLTLSNGSTINLPPIADSSGFTGYQFSLNSLPPGQSIVSMNIENNNTHRDISLQNVQIFDPDSLGGIRPLNAVSTAQDSIVSMEGIEIHRSVNDISDIIPGVTVTVRGTSEKPVKLTIEPDRESVKDAVFSMVANYNRLMAEINILTRNDSRIIDELSYLTSDERTEYTSRLGSFSGDSTLMQMRNNLMRIINTPYETSAEREMSMLAHIGIGTDALRTGSSGGYDASRLRGYLEIDEKVLDAAINSRLEAIKELFANDTTGDLLPDTGVAFSMDALIRPYTESTGLFAQKTGSMNSRIDEEKRRIQTLDRQLALKEADLKKQYGQMEGAFNRMEQMSTSLDRFQQQN
ncbi:MAG: flagellar filament capping protein FliD, partial [Treponema sp.]|nr:flagellar filament capping protein FliD [Treponema sp.]